MNVETDRWIEAVTKLVRLTQEGSILWRSSRPSDEVKKQPTDKIQHVLTATHKGRELRLYKRIYEAYKPRIEPIRLFSSDYEKYWATEVVLELLDDEDLATWSFPNVSVLDDLLSSAQYQVTGAKTYIDELLRDSD